MLLDNLKLAEDFSLPKRDASWFLADLSYSQGNC